MLHKFAPGLLFFLCYTVAATAQPGNTLVVLEKPGNNTFSVFTNTGSASFYVDNNDAKVVDIAANAFVHDIELISGKKMQLNNSKLTGSFQIVAGTIGQSQVLDGLVKTGKVDIAALKGKWECFLIKVVNGNKLMIAGSDPRGTAYGIFYLSKLMGISPFVWWADAVPKAKKQLFISGSYISKEPSVKYRGIFLNDEDWGLQPWAAKTFEPETGDIGPKTYAKIFELLLRLKANLIWPAMHPSTKAFFKIPGNAKVAEDYSIVIGSSHAEPMLRNNVGEWDEKAMGAFNYISNKEAVYKYWEDRVKESRGINGIYSMGMRGVHDSKMEGVKDAKDAASLLDTIFSDQRNLLTKYINKDIKAVPQVFTAYKEVLEIYDNGLKLPDDVTLVWPDDNYGYIQRLNNEEERKRPGGSGIYYHASYWGRPHDYLWISTTHPALIQEEMMKAYENGSDCLWVLNVGDIKPLEYNIECFLDMAYNAVPFKNKGYSKQHLLQWASSLFGKEKSPAIQSILWDYYQLAFERRPEFMGWSQTEPTTKTNYTTFNHFYYGDEAQKRIDRYQSLENKVKVLRKQIQVKDAAAFYQLVYYPVRGASLMTKKFLYRDKSVFYAKQNRLSAVDYARLSIAAYDTIIMETDYFNDQLSGGKWKHMLSMKPRNLPVFLTPELPAVITDRSAGWGIAPEGYSGSSYSGVAPKTGFDLPAFDNVNKQQYFIDIFLTDSLTINWTALASAAWIKLSAIKGTLSDVVGKKQLRLYVSVDWNKVPPEAKFSGEIEFKGGERQFSVAITGENYSLSGFKGFVENNGYISLQASHYSKIVQNKYGKWQLLPGLGYAGESLESQPIALENTQVLTDTAWIRANSSYTAYDFYTFSEGHAELTVFSLPTHPLNNMYSMRCAVSIDEGPLQLADFRTYGRSEEWKQNVLRNRAEKEITLPFLKKGKHQLRIYSIDPGVILDALVIDLGGLKNAYSIIPETIIK